MQNAQSQGGSPGTARLFGFQKVQARRGNRPDRKLIGAVGDVNFLILGKLSGVNPHRAECYVPACFQYFLAKIGRYVGKIRPVRQKNQPIRSLRPQPLPSDGFLAFCRKPVVQGEIFAR